MGGLKMASVEIQEHSPKCSKLQNTDTMFDSKNDSNKLTSGSEEHNVSKDTSDTIQKKNDPADVIGSIKDKAKATNCDNTENENKVDINVVQKEIQHNNCNIDKTEDVQIKTLDSSPTCENDSKNSNGETAKEPTVKSGNSLKRKRRNLVTQETDSPLEENNTRSKRKKTKNTSDKYCWRCHKESVEAHCSACPRSWHRRCIGGTPPSSVQNWICGECATILRAENAETRSTAMAQLSVDQLCLLLKHVVERMRDYPGSEPFWKPVELADAPNYFDYVVKPMDLTLLESNVRAKLYGSTDAFMADAKWVQHNCIVFNTCGGVYTDRSKLTNVAKQIIKLARQEVSEIEACPDCYAHGRNLPRPQPSWFIEPCRRPHPLVWAKLKGFPFWPAKVMPRINSQGFVDVRFFGEHDRAWVSPRDLYLYSEDPPVPLPRKRKLDMDECVREITRHCRKLELVFGQFKFAPPKVQYNPHDPTQIKLMLPNYDPLHPKNCISSQFLVPKKRTFPKKRISSIKLKSQSDAQQKDTSDNDSKTIVDCDTSVETELFKTESKVVKVQKLEKSEKVDDSSIKIDSDEVEEKKNGEQAVVSEIKVLDKIKEDEDVTPGPSKSDNIDNADGGKHKSNEEHTAVPEQIDTLLKIEDLKMLAEDSSKETELARQSVHKNTEVDKKEQILKNNVGKGDNGLNSSSTQKTSPKTAKTVGKVYKPKTRMVDKVNAEEALKSISTDQNQKLDSDAPSKTLSMQNDLLPLKDTLKNSDINAALSTLPSSKSQISSTDVPVTILPTPAKNSDQSVALFLVLNSGLPESVKQPVSKLDKEKNSDVPVIVQPASKDLAQTSHHRKESKARKSFPNKPRSYQHVISQTSSNTSPSSIDSMVYIPAHQVENTMGYQLVPPEAGPISARLYHGAQDLARKMAQLMEEAYKEAAQENQNCENGTSENHQATVHFLRLQIERMRWQHQQQLAELKHNTDCILREMRASLEAERLRAVEETRREAEEDKIRCIEEIKRKQWCAMCGREALFYCCWNTAYCDYPCQQSHWPTHMTTCAQQPSFTTIVTSSAANSNQQQNHNAKVNNPAGRVCALSHSKLSEISTSLSLSYSVNEGNQESS